MEKRGSALSCSRVFLQFFLVFGVILTLAGVGTGGELRKVKYVFPRTIEVLEDTPFWAAITLGYWKAH